MAELPTLFIPHGGGPCFFMDWDPPDTWQRVADWLRRLPDCAGTRPDALLVISAHWEAPIATVTSGARPTLIYDYYGFPESTYRIEWPAPGEPALAARVRGLLSAAGIANDEDAGRGFDHGVFIPLKVAIPEADIPVVQLSLVQGLDPAAHLAIGRALAPLRRDGVLIVGSGMSYHNMQRFRFQGGSPDPDSVRFDAWLGETVALPQAERDDRLVAWTQAPGARAAHPREEHLLPLHVAAGAAGPDAGARVLRDTVMASAQSAFRFGPPDASGRCAADA